MQGNKGRTCKWNFDKGRSIRKELSLARMYNSYSGLHSTRVPTVLCITIIKPRGIILVHCIFIKAV